MSKVKEFFRRIPLEVIFITGFIAATVILIWLVIVNPIYFVLGALSVALVMVWFNGVNDFAYAWRAESKRLKEEKENE